MLRSPLQPILRSPISLITDAIRRAFSWFSLFADGTQGFRINVEEALRLNRQAIGSKTSGFTAGELAACVAFQDSAGTLPVVSMEQPLGLILDTKLGVPVRGAELLSDPSFENPSSWVTQTGWSVSGGKLVASGAAANSFTQTAVATVTAGKWYEATISCDSLVSGGWKLLQEGGKSYLGDKTTAGTFTGKLYAESTGKIYIWANSTLTASFDSISVRELPGNHFVQPSNTASRPIVSRLVNRVTNTGFTLGAVGAVPTGWIERGNVTGRVIEDATAPSGRAMRVTVSAGGGVGATSDVRVTATELVSATYKIMILAKRVSGGSAMLAQGAATTSASLTLTDQYAWYEATMTATGSSNSLFLGGASAITYDIAAVDVRLFSDVPGLPSYQRVTSSTDYDESGFPAYARFDGLDDWLETGGTVDMTSTDKVTVLAGVTKLSDAATAIVLESSPTLSSNNGTFLVGAPTLSGSSKYTFSSKGTVEAAAGTTSTAFNAPHKALLTGIGRISTDTSVLRINGAQAATYSVDQGTGNYAAQKFYMGRRGGASLPFNGRIYGVTVVGKLLTDSQLAAAEQAERNMGRLY